MSLPATRRSATLPLQVLVSGRVRDSLTGGVPRGVLRVRLVDRGTQAEWPLLGRVLPDGSFGFFGPADGAFPRLTERTYRLRVEASAPNYQADSLDLEVGPAAGQPALVTRPSAVDGIADMQVRLFTGGGLPRTGVQLSLNRNAVRLRGRVHVAGDPSDGINRAWVKVMTPPRSSTPTSADGRFELPDPLPVALSIQIRVSAQRFEPLTLTYEPDYTQPVNTLVIGLKRS